jgi:hypothetical protein
MRSQIEILPEEAEKSRRLFSDEEYEKFRESFVDEVIPQQQQWLELRRRSEEQARQRFVR